MRSMRPLCAHYARILHAYSCPPRGAGVCPAYSSAYFMHTPALQAVARTYSCAYSRTLDRRPRVCMRCAIMCATHPYVPRAAVCGSSMHIGALCTTYTGTMYEIHIMNVIMKDIVLQCCHAAGRAAASGALHRGLQTGSSATKARVASKKCRTGCFCGRPDGTRCKRCNWPTSGCG